MPWNLRRDFHIDIHASYGSHLMVSATDSSLRNPPPEVVAGDSGPVRFHFYERTTNGNIDLIDPPEGVSFVFSARPKGIPVDSDLLFLTNDFERIDTGIYEGVVNLATSELADHLATSGERRKLIVGEIELRDSLSGTIRQSIQFDLTASPQVYDDQDAPSALPTADEWLQARRPAVLIRSTAQGPPADQVLGNPETYELDFSGVFIDVGGAAYFSVDVGDLILTLAVTLLATDDENQLIASKIGDVLNGDENFAGLLEAEAAGHVLTIRYLTNATPSSPADFNLYAMPGSTIEFDGGPYNWSDPVIAEAYAGIAGTQAAIVGAESRVGDAAPYRWFRAQTVNPTTWEEITGTIELVEAAPGDATTPVARTGGIYKLAPSTGSSVIYLPTATDDGETILFQVINSSDPSGESDVQISNGATTLATLGRGAYTVVAKWLDGSGWAVSFEESIASGLKGSVADSDNFFLEDHEDSFRKKRSTFGVLWTWIKAKIDLGQTWAGAHAFSSTTRPTSAGTGTPGVNSLITEADMRERLLADATNVYVRQQMGWDAGPWVTVGASPSYLADGNGVAGMRLIGSTGLAAASAQGGGIKYPDGGATGGTMATLTRAWQMRFLFRNQFGSAGANAFFVSLRNNTDFWSNSSIGLYHVPQPANSWQAGTPYVSGDRVNVAGIVQVVATGGTSGGTEPSWNAARNGTTTDNTVTWRNLGPHTSNKWAMGFVDASGNISLTDTGVAWVTGTSNTTLLSLRSDGSSVFASVNGSAEVSVARGALFAATPYVMGRGDSNVPHRIAGLLFTFGTTPQ